MGLRGKLPELVVVDPKPLLTLTAPNWLDPEARNYWQRHAAWLASNDLLNASTADSFAALCEVWGRLAAQRNQPSSRTFLDLHKMFMSSAKLFRLLPVDRPGTAPTARHEAGGEYEFV
jgi:hypothetical protein